MASVIVGEDYSIKIPKSIRERMKIEPGQKLDFIVYRNTLHVLTGMSDDEVISMRGIMKGKIEDTRIEREPDRILP